MALDTKQPPQPGVPSFRPQRTWKVPVSKAWWIWLILSVIVYLALFAMYSPVRNNPDLGAANEPFLLIGVCAFLLLLTTAAFSLRRRFARWLPGKAQDWLWMHTWVSLLVLLVSFLHENYDHITHAEPLDLIHCAPDSHFGVIGLYGLILLVLSGVMGRVLDVWQAQVIARDARANGVGIVESLKKQSVELEYVVERLSAGKSLLFKQYCMQAINTPNATSGPPPLVPPGEQRDFQQACQTLNNRSSLVQSLQRQEQARRIMRIWRTVHIAFGCFVLVVVVYHVGMESLSHVLTILPMQVNTCS